MKAFRIALFSDCTSQLLVRELRLQAPNYFDAIDIQEYPFTSPLAVQEELKHYNPDAVILWNCSEMMSEKQPEPLAPILALPYTFLVYTMVSRDDGAFGSSALSSTQSLRKRILQWNLDLLQLATVFKNLYIVDLDLLQSRLGRVQTFDARLWETAKLALSPTATSYIATDTLSLLSALNGRVNKVLVTDLDNTVWGGITGEGGADSVNPDAPGHRAYRRWLQQLASRGILLAIASHNDYSTVETLFNTYHLEFRLSDFQACEINWDPKAEMLKRIAAKLHIHLDSIVFIDDRREQREAVREALPQVTVPELPTDPALWMEYLSQAHLFETPRITTDDLLRIKTFQADVTRAEFAQTLSRDEYIRSLQQELITEPLNENNCERAAQLTQRCNRFNMRGTRHTAAELLNRKGWVYALRDRFGDLGIVSAVILDGNTIETWVMSCRVFNRDVEIMILNHLKSIAPIRGEYCPTDRNIMCRNIYQANGIPLP